MSKKRIIVLSVIIGVLALILILFGAVFRLRRQTVTYLDDSTATISSSEIISTAGLNYGSSIFMLDKDSATENLENEYPYLKVIQIKTVSVIEVEIIVRERYETYYASFNNKYYILDEDLKVLNILETEPTTLTFIDSSELGITSKTVICDFVGTEEHQNLISSLYSAMYKTVKIDGEYLDREGIIALINTISFDTGAYTLNGETYLYDRIILTTSYGIIIDIGKPETDLDNKVNACFSALNVIVADSAISNSGTIKYVYLDGGEASLRYSEASE